MSDQNNHNLLILTFSNIFILLIFYFYRPAFLDIFSFGKSERGIFLITPDTEQTTLCY